MKARKVIALSAVVALSSFGQGTFQNLDFESAVIVPITSDRVQFGAAFPGWNGYYIETMSLRPLGFAAYPDPGIGSALMVLKGFSALSGPPIAGNYNAILQPGFNAGFVGVGLEQTGLVPAGTMSLRFLARDAARSGIMVTMNGVPLDLVTLQDFGFYQEMGANIPAYAGQTTQLRFDRPYIPSGDLWLDNISFSTVGVPEPGTWALLGLGSALLWSATRRRRK